MGTDLAEGILLRAVAGLRFVGGGRRGAGGVTPCWPWAYFSRHRKQEGRPAARGRVSGPRTGKTSDARMASGAGRVRLLASGLGSGESVAIITRKPALETKQYDVLNGGLVGVKGFLNLKWIQTGLLEATALVTVYECSVITVKSL